MHNSSRAAHKSIIDELELSHKTSSIVCTCASCGVDQLWEFFCAKVNPCLVRFVPSNSKPTHKCNPWINYSVLQLNRKINCIEKSSRSVTTNTREMRARLHSMIKSTKFKPANMASGGDFQLPLNLLKQCTTLPYSWWQEMDRHNSFRFPTSLRSGPRWWAVVQTEVHSKK